MNDILLRAQVRIQTALSSLRRQEGQGLVEYGLIIASIAILLIVAMLFLGGRIDDLFSDTGSSIDSPGPLCGNNVRNRRPGSLAARPDQTRQREVHRPGYPLDRAGARFWFHLSQ